MKLTWSGIAIVTGTGKIGGSVVQGGRFGSIGRVWIKPTTINLANFNANSEKEYFRFITSAWRTLTSVQRTSWTPLVPSGLSGFNLFVQKNLVYYRLNGTLLTSAPVAAAFPTLSAIDIAIDGGTQQITLDYTSAGIVANWYINLFVINNLSPGVQYPQKSLFRLINSIRVLAGPNTSVVDVRIKNVDVIVGSQTFAKLVLVNKVTGQMSAQNILSNIVT
jgi:hypothetical protein